MKYLIGIILLTTLFFYGHVMEAGFPLILNIGITVLVFVLLIIWEFSILNKKIEAKIKFRSQTKEVLNYYVIAALWIALLIWLHEFYANVDLLMFLLIFPLAHLLLYFVYKSKKPYTIFITENQLLVKLPIIQKRELEDLNEIQFDRYSKDLILKFISQPQLTIKTTKYKNVDIASLLAILLDKSNHNVFIPLNFKPHSKW